VQLCDIFRARIVDAAQETLIVEITGDEDKITSMVELLRPIGIVEMVRTGVVTMARGEHVLAPNGYETRSNGFRANVL
jgi:acetolactate synthase-1/3 small subunit